MEVFVQECSLIPVESNRSSARVLLSPLAHFAWYVQYRTRFLFFSRPDEGWRETISRLRSGLETALDCFYPLAGRLHVRDDGLMEADCCGEGVMFVEASASFALEELPFEGCSVDLPPELLRDLAQTPGFTLRWPWSSDAPLFFIQVTQLSCGGLCISVRFNHQVLDGTSAWHFFMSWAETSCGKEISLPPTFRSFPIEPTTDHELPIPPYLKLYKKPELVTPGQAPDLQTKCFLFPKEVITRLKEKTPGFTTFQLLTAHVWERITAARGLSENETTRLLFAVNSRRRLPELGGSYFGQGAVIVSASSIAGEVWSKGKELLKETIVEMSEEKLVELMKLVGAYARDEEYSVFTRFTSGTDLVVGSSFYFPVYEDFGFGKPVGMAIDPTPGDGRLYYFPGREAGSVALYVTLKPETLTRLQNDPTFVHGV